MPNSSKGKVYQTRKICGKYFFPKSCRKWGRKTSFRVNDVINYEINLSFLIKPLFYVTKLFRAKTLMSQEWKELLRWNKKHFLSFLKGFQLPEVVSDLGVALKRTPSSHFVCWRWTSFYSYIVDVQLVGVKVYLIADLHFFWLNDVIYYS